MRQLIADIQVLIIYTEKTCYIWMDIKSFECIEYADPFPLLTKTGLQYFTKTMWETINYHYTVNAEFYGGYYFDEGFNDNIKKLTTELYALRQKLADSPLQRSIKWILNSMWGKAKPKKVITKTIPVPKERAKDFQRWHQEFVYRSAEKGDITEFEVLQPFTFKFGIPQFAVNVLSWSRAFMSDLYYKYSVWYSNTDCLLLTRKEAEELIGPDLGQFKIEIDSVAKAVIYSARNVKYFDANGESINNK